MGEAFAAVVKAADALYAVPAPGSLSDVGVAVWVVAAVIGLSESAKLHRMAGSA